MYIPGNKKKKNVRINLTWKLFKLNLKGVRNNSIETKSRNLKQFRGEVFSFEFSLNKRKKKKKKRKKNSTKGLIFLRRPLNPISFLGQR